MSDDFAWNTAVGCEGGPLIIAPAEVYVAWPGPRYLPLDRRTSLHVWGQFTGELPDKFHPTGPTGHQWIRASGQTLFDLRDELVETIKSTWPDARIAADDSRGQILRSDRKQLWFNLAPLSEYEKAWQESGEGEQAYFHAWDSHRALFWDIEGPGTVDVGISGDRSELLLLRTWVDDEVDEQTARAHASAQRVTPADLAALETGATLIVAWAQADPHEIESVDTPADYARRAAAAEPCELDLPDIRSICAALHVAPGAYSISYDSYEADEWSCRWCRLTRQASSEIA